MDQKPLSSFQDFDGSVTLAFYVDRNVKLGVILRSERVQKLFSVKLNLEHTILLNAFRRNKFGKVASCEVHHVSCLLIDVGEETNLLNA